MIKRELLDAERHISITEEKVSLGGCRSGTRAENIGLIEIILDYNSESTDQVAVASTKRYSDSHSLFSHLPSSDQHSGGTTDESNKEIPIAMHANCKNLPTSCLEETLSNPVLTPPKSSETLIQNTTAATLLQDNLLPPPLMENPFPDFDICKGPKNSAGKNLKSTSSFKRFSCSEAENDDRKAARNKACTAIVNFTSFNKNTSTTASTDSFQSGFLCRFCPSSCRSLEALDSHTRERHARISGPDVLFQNPFQDAKCLICGARFAMCFYCGVHCSSDEAISLHYKVHTSSFFSCTICKKGYETKGNEFHLFTHEVLDPICGSCKRRSRPALKVNPMPIAVNDIPVFPEKSLKNASKNIAACLMPIVLIKRLFIEPGILSVHLQPAVKSRKRDLDASRSLELSDKFHFTRLHEAGSKAMNYTSVGSEDQSLCSVDFFNADDFADHTNVLAGNELQSACGTTVASDPRSHLVESMEQDYLSKYEVLNVEDATESCIDNRKRKTFSCEVCESDFVDVAKLVQHTKDHFSGKTRLSGLSKDSTKINNGGLACAETGCSGTHLIHSDDFRCELCDAVFNSAQQLIAHMQHHVELDTKVFDDKSCEKPHQCTMCEAEFYNLKTFENHMKAHIKQKGFLCHICEKGYKFQHILDQHIATHHTGHQYFCKFCEMAFHDKYSLHRHREMECTANTLCCEICTKTFVGKENLAAHMALHCAKGMNL